MLLGANLLLLTFRARLTNVAVLPTFVVVKQLFLVCN